MKQKKHKEANFISAVLYLHKQEKNVIPFLEKICRMLETNFENFEIICVDDDAGEQIYRQIVEFQKNRDVTISVIHMGFCQGIETGMNAGVDLSIGDYVFEFDSGFAEYEEPLMMEAYEKCMAGYDIVSVRMPKTGGRLSSKILLMTFMFKYLETIVKLLFKKQKYSVQTIENMNCYEGKKGGCVNDK